MVNKVLICLSFALPSLTFAAEGVKLEKAVVTQVVCRVGFASQDGVVTTNNGRLNISSGACIKLMNDSAAMIQCHSHVIVDLIQDASGKILDIKNAVQDGTACL